MTYGFEAYSDNGDILISSEYPVYHLLEAPIQGNSTTVRNVTRRTYSVFYDSPNPPVIFLKLDVGDYGAINNFVQSGVNWLFDVAGNIRDTTSKILAYGKVQYASTSGFGLQVLNASSQVMFDSFKNPLWAAQFFYFPGGTALASPGWNQINGTFSQPYVAPIFLANMLATATTPPPSTNSSVFGIKRTGLYTWQTTQFNNTSEPVSVAISTTVYDVGILICEGII